MTFIFIIWFIGACILIYVIFNFICITNLKSDEWVNSNAEMETYRDTLHHHISTYAPNYSEQEIDDYVNEQFTIYLISQYSRCSTIYNENNVYRQKRLTYLAISTYTLLVLTFIVSLFFVYQKFEGETNESKSNNTTTTTTTTNQSHKR